MNNLITRYYALFDLALKTVITPFVDIERIQVVIESEIQVVASDSPSESNVPSPADYTHHISAIHDRVSALIGHISIMIAILLFTVTLYESGTASYYVLLIELIVYLTIAILCLRCMRSYGFEKEYDPEVYRTSSLEDIALRFAYFRFANFMAINATFVLIVAIVVNPPSGHSIS